MIIIDYQDRRPLYEQIVEKFQRLIMRGVLGPDEQMPSVRSLAVQLSINPNTIQRAYAELERQGWIYPVKGRGNFVAPIHKIMEEKKNLRKNQLEELLGKCREEGFTQDEIQQMVHKIWGEET